MYAFQHRLRNIKIEVDTVKYSTNTYITVCVVLISRYGLQAIYIVQR